MKYGSNWYVQFPLKWDSVNMIWKQFISFKMIQKTFLRKKLLYTLTRKVSDLDFSWFTSTETVRTKPNSSNFFFLASNYLCNVNSILDVLNTEYLIHWILPRYKEKHSNVSYIYLVSHYWKHNCVLGCKSQNFVIC